MTAYSPEMLERLRESLLHARSIDDAELYPVKGMAGHFCSFQETPNTPELKQVFSVEVDGTRVFVYLKVA